MKSYHNIESRKSPFGDYYVGYSDDGRGWRIRGRSGNWTAIANVTCQGSLNRLMGYDTLAEISAELEKIGKPK